MSLKQKSKLQSNVKDFTTADMALIHAATDQYLLQRKQADMTRTYTSVMRFGIESYYQLLTIFANKRITGTKPETYLKITALMAYKEADRIIENEERIISAWLSNHIQKVIAAHTTGETVKTYQDLTPIEALSLTVYANSKGHSIKTDGKVTTVPEKIYKEWQKDIDSPFIHLRNLPVLVKTREEKRAKREKA